jgi:hypothetical protein
MPSHAVTIFTEGVPKSVQMNFSIPRYFLFLAMAVAACAPLQGQAPSQSPTDAQSQAPSGILHAQGGMWVNGSEARDSTAIFAGDLLETKPGFSATLNLDGTEILLTPETIGKFEGNSLDLDHGAVSIGTSKGFKVKVHCITVTPASSVWTQYEVSDLSGTLQVVAHKGDVTVEVGITGKATGDSGTSSGGTLHEGEQKSYQESQLCGTQKEPASPGSGLNPKWIAAGAAGAGILIWLLIHNTGGGSSPITPSTP